MAKALLVYFVLCFCIKEALGAIEFDAIDKAHKTLCLSRSGLSASCCKEIAEEVENPRKAYITSCKGKCDRSSPLGIESGRVPDSAFKASSVYSSSYEPQFARLNKQNKSCSWGPTGAGRIGSWLQVDLGEIFVVTGIATQGSCDMTTEFMKSFSLSFSKNGIKWSYYEECGAKKIFPGSPDHTTIVTNHFSNPFQARFVKVLPQTWKNYPTMRMELYGCRFGL